MAYSITNRFPEHNVVLGRRTVSAPASVPFASIARADTSTAAVRAWGEA